MPKYVLRKDKCTGMVYKVPIQNEVCYKGFYVLDDNRLACQTYDGKKFGKYYTVGKNHCVNGKLELCINGMHCCQFLYQVNTYYPFLNAYTYMAGVSALIGTGKVTGYTYCEVVPFGRIIGDTTNGKICCSRLLVKRRMNRLQLMYRLFDEVGMYGLDIVRNMPLHIIKLMYENYLNNNVMALGGYNIIQNHVLRKLKNMLNKISNKATCHITASNLGSIRFLEEVVRDYYHEK